MKSAAATLVDAGPLVAVFDADDKQHAACLDALKDLRGTLHTVWPAVTEALHLLSFSLQAQDGVLEWIASGSLAPLEINPSDLPRVRELMNKYRDLPMDFTDASLVAVAERVDIRRIFTVDRRDFKLYRPRHVPTFTLLP